MIDKRADLVWQIDDLRDQMSNPIEEDSLYGQLLELECDLRDLDARHRQEQTMWKPPQLPDCVAAIKIPAARWAGRCHEISGKLLNSPKLDIKGQLLYGHYWGPIAIKSIFKGQPFSRHGWIKLDDGRIFDPTRWVFEAVHPYIHVGFDDEEEYDPGGNKLRTRLLRPPPLHEDGDSDQRIDFRHPKIGAFVVDLFCEALHWPRNGRFIRLTANQLIWLGSLPLTMLGDRAKDIYKALIKAGRGVCIPFDNRQMIIGDAYGRPAKKARTSRRSGAW